MSGPFVIPYFIPHMGCPHQCLFCDQRSITGKKTSIAGLEASITATVEEWLSRRRVRKKTHFSFYGGSFTCLPEELQRIMLERVAPYLRKGDIDAVRLSTRPDCIDEKVCTFLQSYGVKVVELGVQSFDDNVLQRVERGHDSADCTRAVKTLQKAGFSVGVQLMPGLPGEDRTSFKRSVKTAISLQPSFVRLYPVLVVGKSGLAELYQRGQYTPLSLGMAVVLVRWAQECFEKNTIPVVRMGLQPSPSLEENLIAGPYHPAFGELVISRQWLMRMKKLFGSNPGRKIQVYLSPSDVSAFYGHRKRNRQRFGPLGIEERIEIIVEKTRKKGSWSYVVG